MGPPSGRDSILIALRPYAVWNSAGLQAILPAVSERGGPMTNVDGTDKKAWPAIWNGTKCRCPKCGKAWLFHHYAEQVEHCPACGEPLARYNVGLILPLVVITLMVHILGFVMLEMELNGHGSPLIYLYVLVPLAVIIPLAILPSAKGAIIGLLWAKGWSDELDR